MEKTKKNITKKKKMRKKKDDDYAKCKMKKKNQV